MQQTKKSGRRQIIFHNTVKLSAARVQKLERDISFVPYLNHSTYVHSTFISQENMCSSMYLC